MIVDAGLLEKVKIGNSNYYINTALVSLFMSNQEVTEQVSTIESVD